MKLINQVDVRSKRVFLRADLDIDVETHRATSREREIGAETEAISLNRLISLRPTIDYLLSQNCQIIIAGHRKRPTGPDPKLSTKPLAGVMAEIIGQDVEFQEDVNTTPSGRIVLLENLRFYPGEVANDVQFAQRLAQLADVYVNEAFANCHRNHASMVALPQLLPHQAGFGLEIEVRVLSKLLESPPRPFVAVIGGAKLETKIPVINNLSEVADKVLIGGALPMEILKKRYRFNDNVMVATLDPSNRDISEESSTRFAAILRSAKSIAWNGPMGQFEQGYNRGSLAVAWAMVESGAYTIAGGGETAKLLSTCVGEDGISFISNGGGAMLELLAGNELPGLKALD